MNVIGTASIDMEKFREFRKNATDWISSLWTEYFYPRPDLRKYAEAGYDLFFQKWTPKEEFDRTVEDVNAYLEKMEQKWELLYQDDIMSVLRFGSVSFGIPSNLVDADFYQDLDDRSPEEFSTGFSLMKNNTVTRKELKNRELEFTEALEDQKKYLQELENKKKAELERIKQELDKKYESMMMELKRKKEEMQMKINNLHKEMFLLDTELYAIRCFMGEVIKFSCLRSGKAADIAEPVVLYQKMRFLDEEMGKYLSLYGVDGDDMDLFEDVLKARDDIMDLFAPGPKSISLIRISRSGKYTSSSDRVANMLQEYELYHGQTIGILIRDGENLYIGWTDQDRISIPEDMFLKPGIEEKEDAHTSSKEEVASRYFIFAILQGVMGKLIRLPEKVDLFKPSLYVIMSMADGWIEDNKYGTFNEMVNEWNSFPMQKGDPLLTLMRITRDDYYQKTCTKPYYNDRGRGYKNRTYDAILPSRSVLPLNHIDREDYYDIHVEKFLVDDDMNYTDESLGYGVDEVKADNYILRGVNIKKWNIERVKAFMTAEYQDKVFYGQPMYSVKIKEVVHKRTLFKYYIAAKKGGSNVNANMEVCRDEVINLAFADSVRIRYIIRSKKVGKFDITNFASLLPYLHTALEYLDQREKEEAAMLSPYMELNEGWQADLADWRKERKYHRLTPARAMQYAKEKKSEEN